jgi:ectoine hydroxylase-related dioxygenase (phytanoyl-CoA dioxygenase family)
MRDRALGEYVERFRKDGFVHVPNVLDPAALEVLGRAVDTGVETRKRHDDRKLEEKSLYEQSFVQCEYLWEDFPEICSLTFHPMVGRIAAALLGAEKVRLWHDQALYKEAGGRETEAHQDHAYWPIAEHKTLTAWIPLVRVDHANGCMGYVPGSHLGAVEFINIFTKPGEGKALADRQKAKPVLAPADVGDVLFHDGRTVHMAGANRSNATRRVYTAIYFADGCTRGNARPHPSVDRAKIKVGDKIEGFATPISWPLPEGQFPEPGPWPFEGNEFVERAQRLGILPKTVRKHDPSRPS